MLEVLYDVETKEVRGWCADEKQFGNFRPKHSQKVAILPIELPNYDSLQFYIDLGVMTIQGEPITTPKPRDLTQEINELKDRIDKLEKK